MTASRGVKQPLKVKTIRFHEDLREVLLNEHVKYIKACQNREKWDSGSSKDYTFAKYLKESWGGPIIYEVIPGVDKAPKNLNGTEQLVDIARDLGFKVDF